MNLRIAAVGISNPNLDADATPGVLPPPSTGLTGDGLSNFEEFRGFVVDGVHVRTSTEQKDLFVTYIVLTIWELGSGLAYL